MIIPGLVSATFRDMSCEKIIELCKMANLKAVEWSENSHVYPDDPKGANELYEKTISAGLIVAAYGSYYRLGEYENPEKIFLKSLCSAEALHAPVIRVWAGTKASFDVDLEEREKLTREAALIGKLASEHGIKVAFEWHKNTLTDTNESAIQLLDEANQENLYCLWQPTVALNIEERCKGIKLLKDKLLNLHVYYWDEGVRRPFEEGNKEWKEYLSCVNLQEDRFGLLEFVKDNTEEQFREDAKALLSLLKEFEYK